jgi:hypothetical protein
MAMIEYPNGLVHLGAWTLLHSIKTKEDGHVFWGKLEAEKKTFKEITNIEEIMGRPTLLLKIVDRHQHFQISTFQHWSHLVGLNLDFLDETSTQTAEIISLCPQLQHLELRLSLPSQKHDICGHIAHTLKNLSSLTFWSCKIEQFKKLCFYLGQSEYFPKLHTLVCHAHRSRPRIGKQEKDIELTQYFLEALALKLQNLSVLMFRISPWQQTKTPVVFSVPSSIQTLWRNSHIASLQLPHHLDVYPQHLSTLKLEQDLVVAPSTVQNLMVFWPCDFQRSVSTFRAGQLIYLELYIGCGDLITETEIDALFQLRVPNLQARIRTLSETFFLGKLKLALQSESLLSFSVELPNRFTGDPRLSITDLDSTVRKNKVLASGFLQLSASRATWKNKENINRRKLWAQYALVLAFLRANATSRLKFSILTLAPHILHALTSLDVGSGNKTLGRLVETHHARSHFCFSKRKFDLL